MCSMDASSSTRGAVAEHLLFEEKKTVLETMMRSLSEDEDVVIFYDIEYSVLDRFAAVSRRSGMMMMAHGCCMASILLVPTPSEIDVSQTSKCSPFTKLQLNFYLLVSVFRISK